MGLGKTKQISVQSSVECDTTLNALAWDMDEIGARYMGGKVSRQAVVNGLLLWVGSLMAAERRDILGQGLRRLEDSVLQRQTDEEGDERLDALRRAYLATLSPEKRAALESVEPTDRVFDKPSVPLGNSSAAGTPKPVRKDKTARDA